MKTIGLIGGMSWQSSALYYRYINEETNRHLRGQHNAASVMVTVDFAAIDRLMHVGDWATISELLCAAALQLERAGADLIVLCTNTMHKLADDIAAATPVPMLHIADVTAAAILAQGHTRVGLLATRFTMEHAFYRSRLRERFGIEVLIPRQAQRDLAHRIIFEELCHGIVRPESRAQYQQIIADLHREGAEGIILGCTELELLLTAPDSPIPLYPSTQLHARAAVLEALTE